MDRDVSVIYGINTTDEDISVPFSIWKESVELKRDSALVLCYFFFLPRPFPFTGLQRSEYLCRMSVKVLNS